jgi:hypothetical protein
MVVADVGAHAAGGSSVSAYWIPRVSHIQAVFGIGNACRNR